MCLCVCECMRVGRFVRVRLRLSECVNVCECMRVGG